MRPRAFFRSIAAALVAVTACALLAAVPTTAASSRAGVAARRSTAARLAGLHWRSCDQRFQCSELTVPVSYANPKGPTFGIAVVRLPATDQHHVIGDLVLNPGGPGGSGVDFLEQNWSSFPASLRSRFDLVSFDPRGVERSHGVNCLAPAKIQPWLGVNPDPVNKTQLAHVNGAISSFIAGCEANASRAFLANLGTVVTAEDMDRLRQALGEKKLDYVGFSYGTYLGALYAEHFGSRVRAMVLDGAVDPALSPSVSEERQALGFETDLHDFFAWCRHNSTCAHELPRGAKSGYDKLMKRLEGGTVIEARLKPEYGGTQPVNYGVAEVGVIATLYSKDYWPLLAEAIAAGLAGDGSLLDGLALQYAGLEQSGKYNNIISAETAISCVDSPAPKKVAAYERFARQLGKVAPDFGPSEAWGGYVCAHWPVQPTGHPGAIHAPKAPPIVVVGSTADPATPYSGAVALAHELDRGVLLTRTGAGHTGYFFSSCVRTYVDRYLETLATPPHGTVCGSN
jgi:pimeloyl-ACP methyl ester carboxylesterase